MRQIVRCRRLRVCWQELSFADIPSMAAQEPLAEEQMRRLISAPLVDGGLCEADMREVESIKERCPHVYTTWACVTPCDKCGQLHKESEAHCNKCRNACQEATADEAAKGTSRSASDLTTDAMNTSDEEDSDEEHSDDDEVSEEEEGDVPWAGALL